MDFISVITPQIAVGGLVALVLLVVTFVLVSSAYGGDRLSILLRFPTRDT
jgi:hypothetical protein